MNEIKTCRNCEYCQKYDGRPFICKKSPRKYYVDVMRTHIDKEVCDENFSGWVKRKSWIRMVLGL